MTAGKGTMQILLLLLVIGMIGTNCILAIKLFVEDLSGRDPSEGVLVNLARNWKGYLLLIGVLLLGVLLFVRLLAILYRGR